MPSKLCKWGPLPSTLLPQSVLVQVLKQVPQHERLRSCALVCTAWNTAAAKTIGDDVRLTSRRCVSQKCTALTGWLKAHGQAAPVDSITVQGDGPSYGEQLLLPLQHLPALRKLVVHDFKVAAEGYPETRLQPAVLPRELSALTQLELHFVYMQLSALPAFTQLQHLALVDSRYSAAQPTAAYRVAGDVIALQEALPKLQLLTHLHLGWKFTPDSVLAGLSHLTRLQQLELTAAICTAASFAAGALPQSITRLKFEGDFDPPFMDFSPSSTPAVSQLTGLQELAVGHAGAFDPALLASLTSLDTVYMHNCEMAPSALKHLSGLTGLQRLQLYCRSPEGAAPGSNEDVKALTASSKLTHLAIGERLVQHDQYSHLFTQPSRQLPLLQHLSASMGLLSSLPTVSNMVACCPELESLWLDRRLDEPAAEVYFDEESGYDRHSWSPLSDLNKLTKLQLCVRGVEVCKMAWFALGALQCVRELDILQLDWESCGDVMSLACYPQTLHLTKLVITVGGGPDLLGLDGLHNVEVENTAPEGSPSDVVSRLPYEVLRAAQHRLHTLAAIEAEGIPIADAAPLQQPALQRAISTAQQELFSRQRQHHKEQQELRHQLAEQQSRLDQQEKELSKLRGEMAVMAAQLRAVMQQRTQQ